MYPMYKLDLAVPLPVQQHQRMVMDMHQPDCITFYTRRWLRCAYAITSLCMQRCNLNNAGRAQGRGDKNASSSEDVTSGNSVTTHHKSEDSGKRSVCAEEVSQVSPSDASCPAVHVDIIVLDHEDLQGGLGLRGAATGHE